MAGLNRGILVYRDFLLSLHERYTEIFDIFTGTVKISIVFVRMETYELNTDNFNEQIVYI